MPRKFLDSAYSQKGSGAASKFYADWAPSYDEEVTEAGYASPRRCAEALAAHVDDRETPLLELGCGTGLGGVALTAAGFTVIDGYDIAPEMLAKARSIGVYRHLGVLDLSRPLDELAGRRYAHAAAIGVFNADLMPATVLDEILGLLPTGGILAFSLNDQVLAEGSFSVRLFEIVECGVADLVFKEHGDHLPGIALESTICLVRKR